MLPAGAMDLAAAAAEYRIIDRHLQVSAGRQHQQHRQLRDGQAELVKFPAGTGEEIVRPVVRPPVLQGAPQQHAGHGTAADLPGQPAGQAAEGTAMSVIAFPVLARILTDRGIHRTRIGGIALASAAIDDVLAWSLLAVVAAIAGAGGQPLRLVLARCTRA